MKLLYNKTVVLKFLGYNGMA